MTSRTRRAFTERDRGFTLIELLVVILIIGILAAVAIPVFLNQRRKGVDASLKTDLRNLAAAVETVTANNPASTTPFTAAELRAAGFSKTGNNTVLAVGTPQHGYCLAARNDAGTASASNAYLQWDSLEGGLTKPVANAAFLSTNCNATFLATHGGWKWL